VQDGALWTEGLRWTKAAQQGLASGEWRYFSPAVKVDSKTNRVVEYINTALVNRPATYAMKPLVMSQDDGDEETPQETPKMKLVLSALGLGEAATEAEALDAVTKVRASQKQLVALTGKSDADEALGVVAAWKAKAEEAVTLSAKLEKLETERKETELLSLVDDAVKAGKLPPVLKEQALTFGRQNIGFVKAFIDTLSSKVAPDAAPQDKRPPVVAMSAELEKAAKAHRLDPAAVAAHFQKKQAEWAAEDGEAQ
jgi:phage I-like protein